MSNENKIGWHFQRTRGIMVKLPYEEHLNSDDAKIITTFGREHTQNGIDAGLVEYLKNVSDLNVENKDPVKIKFKWVTLKDDDFFKPYINELIPKLEKMDSVYDKNKVDLGNPRFLIVEDYNTSGLTGDFDPPASQIDMPNNYNGFFYKLGYSGKAAADSTSGGRRGIGRAVSAIVSSVNTMFLLSKRYDDKKTFLKGMCLGKKFVENKTVYDGYGYFDNYDNSEKNSMPIFEDSYIRKISDKLGIDRYQEFGTSTIIPFPDKNLDSESVKKEILRNYYVVISQGNLEIEIANYDGREEEKEIINKENILTSLKNNNLYNEYNFLNDFINNCFLNLNHTSFELSTKAAEDGKIDQNDFTKDEIVKIRNSFNNGELINIKAKIGIKPKKKDNKITATNHIEETFVNFFLKKVDNDTTGKVYFQRGLMPLMGEGAGFNASAYGFMYAYDRPAVSFIAASEGTNHLKINTSEQDLRENYRIPYNIQATFIKKGLDNLVNLMLLLDEEEDNEFLKDYFQIADEEIDDVTSKPVQEEADDEEVKDDEDDEDIAITKSKTTDEQVEEIKTSYKEIQITRLKSKKGFKIKANKKYEQIGSIFPMKIKFVCAYAEIGRKKSFKAHEALDFDFHNDDKIKIDMSNAEIHNKGLNEIIFTLKNVDCEISIYGFYEKFEVDALVETIL